MSVWKNIWTVIYREFMIIREHPIYLFGSVGVMLACAVFYFTFFNAGLPSDIPIGVVDLDGSSVSREFRRQLDATQLGTAIPFGSFE
ncbi:MAG: ABC transporter permease, partial [Bacteroidales bacterium]|nr:ABC transporter permease [Bacteroidales bacterium]